MPSRSWRSPSPHRSSLVVTLATALLTACHLPSDASGSFHVEIQAVPIVSLGDTVQMRSRLVGDDGVIVPDVPVTYTSSDSATLLIDGSGRMIALRRGNVMVIARSRDYGNARPDSLVVRVRDPRFDIDSVVPTVIHSGDIVSIYGSGLDRDSILAVILSSRAGTIAGNAPPDQGGTGVLRFWAPLTNAGPVRLDVFGDLGQRTSPDSLTFIAADSYEPNDDSARYLGVMDTTWRAPWLVFEPGADSSRDRYSFENPDTHTVQVRIASALDQALITVEVRDSLGHVGNPAGWVVSNQRRSCRLFPLDPLDPRAIDADPSLRVTLSDLPPGRYYLNLAVGPRSDAVAYTLNIELDPGGISADAYEDDDNCVLAPIVALPIIDQRRSLDHPTDVDWVRFTLTDPLTDVVATFSPDSLGMSFVLYGDTVGSRPPLIARGADSLHVALPAGTYALSMAGRKAQRYRLNVSATPLASPRISRSRATQ